jgi:ribosomal protein S18 acetylase RimI-like enzyme
VALESRGGRSAPLARSFEAQFFSPASWPGGLAASALKPHQCSPQLLSSPHSPTERPTVQDLIALERAEIEAFADLYAAAPPDVASAAGLSIHRDAETTVLAVARVDVLALNRAVGLGLHRPASDAVLDGLLDVMSKCGPRRFFVPVAPADGNEDLSRALQERGLRHYNNWMRLSRELGDLPEAPESDLVVREIEPDSAAAFGRIVATAFGYPPEVAPLTEHVVGRAGWRHYLAYDGTEPVAAGAMYLSGAAAWFGFAATASTHRKRGAQSALVVRRLADARAAGCTSVSVETAEDSVVKDAPSFRNLRRLGFEVAYTRPNFLWMRPEG